jgi:hypothetical protein
MSSLRCDQVGQASCTHVPQARLRASCLAVTGRPQRPQHCPAARAELSSQPTGPRSAGPSPTGSEPVTGSPRPPGQKCCRCAWTTRSPIGARSRRSARKPGPARLTRRMSPRPPRHSSGSQPPRSWRLRSVTVILPAEAGTLQTWWTQHRRTVNQALPADFNEARLGTSCHDSPRGRSAQCRR